MEGRLGAKNEKNIFYCTFLPLTLIGALMGCTPALSDDAGEKYG